MSTKKPNIKVLHIVSGNLNMGAARGALWLHHGLQKYKNINSQILNNSNSLSEKGVNTISGNFFKKLFNWLRVRVDIYAKKIYPKSSPEIFSTGLVGYDFTKLKIYKEADIIHLHWINNGLVKLSDIKKIDKPIIWTIRDMWPFTGGCHYPNECTRYELECGNCEHLKSGKEKDLSSYILKRKNKLNREKEITYIAISDWLARLAKESSVLKDSNVSVIYNNINLDLFFPTDKEAEKLKNKIQSNKKIILAGAVNNKNRWKGFNYIFDLIKVLDKNKYLFCFFGKSEREVLDKLEIDYIDFGFIKEAEALRSLYAMSDVFVSTSIQEAFGKTVVEAMACETPVLCFDNSGPGEIVEHKISGYTAQCHSVEDLKTGIEWLCFESDYEKVKKEARKRAIENYDSTIIAKQYAALYQEVLS